MPAGPIVVQLQALSLGTPSFAFCVVGFNRWLRRVGHELPGLGRPRSGIARAAWSRHTGGTNFRLRPRLETPFSQDLSVGWGRRGFVSCARAREAAVGSASSNSGLWNDGSMGHPDLCSRPCLYFASGKCAFGDRCEFCHLPHSKRPVHLSKKHREMMQEMEPASATALILPILEERRGMSPHLFLWGAHRPSWLKRRPPPGG